MSLDEFGTKNAAPDFNEDALSGVTVELISDDMGDSISIGINPLREEKPHLLKILLLDRTSSTAMRPRNILWANDNYLQYGAKVYDPSAPILPELVTGIMSRVIKPRALKSRERQKERTKSRAEVFTPTHIIKLQNDELEREFLGDDLETYVRRRWLEVACGEAPYMASRYDMESGEILPLTERVGFLDRKLKRINAEIDDRVQWFDLVRAAYQSAYGFEWNGDSLLLARENLLYTFLDYAAAKWNCEPSDAELVTIAEIISYNVFQMDGINYVIPFTEKRVKRKEFQMTLFGDEESAETTDSETQWVTKPGKRVKVMNWETKKMEYFDKGLRK